MELIREKLSSMLKKAILGTSNIEDFEPEIEIPAIPEHGDYATNCAMVLAKRLKKNPREIASILLEALYPDTASFVENIEVAGPGFINFFMKKEAFHEMLLFIGRHIENFGTLDIGKGKLVQVEFVSANPTGPLHIGHGRGATIGDSIARILKSCGFKVHREYYINDVGKQMEILGRSLYLRYLELFGKEIDFPEDHYRGDYMKDLARELYEDVKDGLVNMPEEEAIEKCSKFAGEKILEGIKKDLSDFRVFYDEWFSESKLHENGTVDEAIAYLKEKGYIYEKDGALWFKSSLWGDEKDRVVVRSNGAKTYFAADIAYHWNKIKRNFELIIDVWGADHHGYVPRMKAVMEALGYNSERLKIILVQLVNLVRSGQPVAMSTRAGEFVTLREVMDEVGVDAARYIFLTRRSDSHLDFDLDLAKAQSSENPVYYVQYAHARISSIFEVAKEKNIFLKEDVAENNLTRLVEPQEIEIIKHLGEFREVVKNSALLLEPHRIPYYLHNLASLFHNYYNHHRVLTDDPVLTQARLYLAKVTQQVIKRALDLIGLSAPDKM